MKDQYETSEAFIFPTHTFPSLFKQDKHCNISVVFPYDSWASLFAAA